ncbi:Putative transposase [Bacillus mycoides]|uniref:Putative transposase n=1 Tax=Bacillus mycoides TaxID=1405 RepID=A0A1G4EJG2_BACMY|nr:Putative transposase [Bacillus mycoides]
MSVFKSDELQLFAQEIQCLLSHIAKDVGFVQRTSM